MKKGMLLIPALLVGLALPTGASANEVKVINDSITSDGRTLMPLRAISEAFGFEVMWNQTTKKATVNDGANETTYTINSKEVLVNGESAYTLDTYVVTHNGKTYIPLRAVAPKGSEIEWDNQKKQASIKFDAQTVYVNTKNSVHINTNLTDSRAKVIAKKVNEIEKLSSIKQKRAYFDDYFTNQYINKVIKYNSIPVYGKTGYNIAFKNGADTFFTYRHPYNSEKAYITQTIYDYVEFGVHLVRTIDLVREDNEWKVNDVIFHIDNERQMMNG